MEPSPTFNPALAAKKLLRESRSGALATLLPASGSFSTWPSRSHWAITSLARFSWPVHRRAVK